MGVRVMSAETKQNIPVTSTKDDKPSYMSSISDMENAIEKFFNRRFPSLWRWGDMPKMERLFEFENQRLPSLDVIDRDNEMLVRAEVPGIDKNDINITLTDNLLTIKGETRKEFKKEEGDYHRHEISSSSFARSVTVPQNVDGSKAVANLKNGVLEITLPKLESSKRHKIAVQ